MGKARAYKIWYVLIFLCWAGNRIDRRDKGVWRPKAKN